MQCPSCGLHNMPGTSRCFQCQAELAAPPQRRPEDYYPGRGDRRGLEHGLRRAVPDRREALRGTFAGWLDGVDRQALADVRRGAASLLPGLGQLHNEEPAKARAFAGSVAGLLLASLVLLKSPLSSWLLLLLPCTVLAAMLDAALVSRLRRDRRPAHQQLGGLAGTVLLVLALALAVFAGLGVVEGAFFLHVRLPADLAGFSTGDELLVPRFGRRPPRAGELHLVRRVEPATGGLDVRPLRQTGGDSLDLVLGEPGQEVVIAGGQVRVAGREVPEARDVAGTRPDATFTLAPDTYLCLQHRQERFDSQVSTVRRLVRSQGPEFAGRPLLVLGPPLHRRLLRGAGE